MVNNGKNTPEVILFDLGGVIVDYRGDEGVRRLAASISGLDAPEALWGGLDALHAFERGEISPDAFAGAVLDAIPAPLSREEFLQIYASWVVGLFDGVDALVSSLQRDRRVACLSNINPVHWARCQEIGVDELFDTQFLSHEMGMRKPEARIYCTAADAMGLAPERILFLDDTIANVEAARAAGMRAEHVAGGDARAALIRAGAL
ncbi:MAG: HAD family phosphatase [Parvularculaceae bacterium]